MEINELEMLRGYAIILSGTGIFIVGNLFGDSILNLIVTNNPSNSSLVTVINYHMIWWSNSLLLLGKIGIIIFIIGVFVIFTDRKNTRKANKTQDEHV